MRTASIAGRGVARGALLGRVLASPALVRAVQTLPSASLFRLVEEVGLEDAAELVGLATPAQLVGVFDEALWRSDRAGEDPRFDAERMGLWLEVLLEAGERFAAQTLAEISPDLVTLALCRRAVVVDLVRLTETRATSPRSPRADDEDDALEHALDARPSQEIAGHLVVARADEGFDALVGVLLALDEHDHGACARLLERAAAVSRSFVDEHGGLVEALSAEETLEADAAGERADRRAAAGHVAPSDAAAFFRLARRAAIPPSRAGASVERDPVTRAYFRELAPTIHATQVERPGAQAELRLRALVEATGVRLDPAPVDTLAGALAILQLRDPVAYDARRAELAYVVNLVIAGCPLGAEGEPPGPADAVAIASAVTSLGARCCLEEVARKAGHEEKAIAALLRHETAERLFRMGLHRLQHDVALVVAERLGLLAARRLPEDPSLRGVIALARKAREDGEPWILRRVVPRIGLPLATAAGQLVSSLLGPLPLLPDDRSEPGSLVPASQRLRDGRGLLASPREIARTVALVGAVLA